MGYHAELELLRKVRNGNRVKRYHTVDMVVGETVGHHSANVAMLCLVISPDASKELLAAALTHDLLEQYTGDIPAPAKWASVELANALHDLEDRYSIFKHDLSSKECHVLKMADMLDLCFKCAEEVKMGNTTVWPILRRGLKYLETHSQLNIVNYIVKEMEHDLEGQ